jgi:hypothetical protein
MTNGEKIKELFPDTKIITQYDNPFGDRFMVFTLNNEDMQVNIDWWNAEYKEPITKNNLGVDAISREDALMCLTGKFEIREYAPSELVSIFSKRIKALPPVTPIRPKGHWIDKQRLFDSCSAECSSCHKRSNGYMHDNGFSLVSTYYDFCPKCGSDNREVEE